MDPKEIVAEMALLLADLQVNQSQQLALAEEQRDIRKKIDDLAGKYSANTDFVVTFSGAACVIKMIDAAVLNLEFFDSFENVIHASKE